MTLAKRKLSPVAASVLVGIVALLVLIVGMFVLVLPQKSHASKLGKDIEATQAQIVQARALAEQKPAQPIRYADLFKLVKAMPDQVDMTGIILQLQQTATDAGISFDSIQPQGPGVIAGYEKVPISLSFIGNYYGLADFLFRLRNLVAVRGGALAATGRLFSVDSIDFSSDPNAFPEISAKVLVNAYVYGTGALPSTGAPSTSAPTTPPTTTTTPTTTTPTTTTTTPTDVSTPPIASGVTP